MLNDIYWILRGKKKSLRKWFWLQKIIWLCCSLHWGNCKNFMLTEQKCSNCVQYHLRYSDTNLNNHAIHVWNQTIHVWNQSILVWNQSIHVWNQTIHIWNQVIHVWNQTIHVWNQTIPVWNRKDWLGLRHCTLCAAFKIRHLRKF